MCCDQTSIISGGTTTQAVYDAVNQVTSSGSTNYSYNRVGNVLSYGSNTLSYDAANQWTSGTINGTSVAYTYDGLSRLSSLTSGTSTTNNWYDVTGLALQTAASATTYLRDPGGILQSISSGGALYNYARDRLGSITGLVSSAGALANTYSYDPWGTSTASTGTVVNPFRFLSGYLDSATSFYGIGNGYYQSEWGRFTQPWSGGCGAPSYGTRQQPGQIPGGLGCVLQDLADSLGVEASLGMLLLSIACRAVCFYAVYPPPKPQYMLTCIGCLATEAAVTVPLVAFSFCNCGFRVPIFCP